MAEPAVLVAFLNRRRVAAPGGSEPIALRIKSQHSGKKRGGFADVAHADAELRRDRAGLCRIHHVCPAQNESNCARICYRIVCRFSRWSHCTNPIFKDDPGTFTRGPDIAGGYARPVALSGEQLGV